MAEHTNNANPSPLPNRSRSTATTNLSVVEERDAIGDVAELYHRYRKEFQRFEVPGILKCFATHPPLLRSMLDLAESFLFVEANLSLRHKEMIATFISAQNICPYCTDSHGHRLLSLGTPPEMVRALQCNVIDAPAISPQERALLCFVDKVNRESNMISHCDVEALQQVGWTEPQIAEAIHTVGLFAMFNRIANAFGLASQGLLNASQS